MRKYADAYAKTLGQSQVPGFEKEQALIKEACDKADGADPLAIGEKKKGRYSAAWEAIRLDIPFRMMVPMEYDLIHEAVSVADSL